jgi:hypothetical protein
MRVIGITELKRDMVLNNGFKVIFMKVNLSLIKKMDKEL